MVEVILPWPPKGLSPNARLHWMAKSKQAKSYRMACFVLCIEAKLNQMALPESGAVTLDIEFIPPDRRARDLDNMLSSVKNGLDGIADALGVNDRRFVFRLSRADQVGGMVKVRITAGPGQ
ncbi:endodeoxyribonuclease RusA [Rhodoferax sp. TH121]|uniref:endodeoxyribonuclease RusA n=1 Tax=Rhodoferax sp. TH121 TaxID=2022803 RepID=UPI000B978473|nr:endodeoxyribonuclease RusA [Rhodoferax sp. TH121]OYQ41080.1 endodeoxyribonuclease RusA [Rhodoferax sp. TH121]